MRRTGFGVAQGPGSLLGGGGASGLAAHESAVSNTEALQSATGLHSLIYDTAEPGGHSSAAAELSARQLSPGKVAAAQAAAPVGASDLEAQLQQPQLRPQAGGGSLSPSNKSMRGLHGNHERESALAAAARVQQLRTVRPGGADSSLFCTQGLALPDLPLPYLARPHRLLTGSTHRTQVARIDATTLREWVLTVCGSAQGPGRGQLPSGQEAWQRMQVLARGVSAFERLADGSLAVR